MSASDWLLLLMFERLIDSFGQKEPVGDFEQPLKTERLRVACES